VAEEALKPLEKNVSGAKKQLAYYSTGFIIFA